MRAHFFVLACTLGLCAAGFAQAGQVTFKFQDKAVAESSGLAASQRYPGLIWTHNDSFNAPCLYLVNGAGQTVLTYNITGTHNLDWEDVAIAGAGENAYLYIGDIGDNFGIRSSLNIIRLREPKLDPAKTGQAGDAGDAEIMAVQYPDGPKDAESLMASPDGRIFILSKAKDGKSRLYATREPFRSGEKVVLQLLSEVKFSGDSRAAMATSGEFSPDGRRLAVTTYRAIHEWTLPAPYDCGKLGAIPAVVQNLPDLPQCEGVCYSSDGGRILVSTEKVNTPVWEFSSPLTVPAK